MIRSTGQSLATKGVLDGTLSLSTAGILIADPIDVTGCTVIPRTLATKGVVACAASSSALALATRGVICCPVVIVEEPEEPVKVPSIGGGGISVPTREQLKKVKVTVICSGETSVQEVVIDPSVSVKTQVLGVVNAGANPVFVRIKR